MENKNQLNAYYEALMKYLWWRKIKSEDSVREQGQPLTLDIKE